MTPRCHKYQLLKLLNTKWKICTQFIIIRMSHICACWAVCLFLFGSRISTAAPSARPKPMRCFLTEINWCSTFRRLYFVSWHFSFHRTFSLWLPHSLSLLSALRFSFCKISFLILCAVAMFTFIENSEYIRFDSNFTFWKQKNKERMIAQSA